MKLELYHRRERQTALEERVEVLEKDKRETDELHDTLMEELEKRDKAVEEAVAMIVMLEDRVDQLVTERNMVRQVENEGLFRSQDLTAEYLHAVSARGGSGMNRGDGYAKVVNRMPSFLSEKSENTENLRNVYLGVRGSALSLPRVAEGSSEAGNTPANGYGSPTLSVLSESSFVSVYGQKAQSRDYPPPVDMPLSLDGVDGGYHLPGPRESGRMLPGKPMMAPARSATANPLSRPNGSSQYYSILGMVDHKSPLQQIERLERTRSGRREDNRPSSQGREFRGDEAMAHQSPARRPTKEEKREALKKVMTDVPGGVRLNDEGFPPTPDTISTSTLHRMKGSNDTLSQQHEAMRDRISGLQMNTAEVGRERFGDFAAEAPLRRGHVGGGARDPRDVNIYDHRDALIPRPRSAGETTVSNTRGSDWGSDSEDDAHSLQSSLDIWMRESTKSGKKGGRASPDLFGFPSSASRGGWAMTSMFGPNNVRTKGEGIGPDAAFMHDLFSLRQSSQSAHPSSHPAPPPPDRRSSLHARTGSTSETLQFPQYPVADETSSNQRQHQARRMSEDVPMRTELQTPVQTQIHQPPPQQPGSDQKKSHYPPITGQQGARAGLNRLFRRSLGGGSSSTSNNSNTNSNTNNGAENTAATNPPEPVLADVPKNTINPIVGAPSWVSRSGAMDDDDRSGATPPPIQFNQRQARRNTAGSEMRPDFIPQADDVSNPETSEVPGGDLDAQKQQVNGAQASATGMRRKWLPTFGLKNKAG